MKHSTSSTTGKVWVDIPCTSLQKFSLTRHAKSATHANSMKAEADFQSSNKTGGIKEAFNKVKTVQEQALVGALKCLYWLCKERIAHTTKYQSLLDLTWDATTCITYMLERMQSIDPSVSYRKLWLHLHML